MIRRIPALPPAMLLLLRVLTVVTLASALHGCAVVSVAGAAAGAAITVGGAVVATGVKVTGAVIEAGVDAVSDDEEDD